MVGAQILAARMAPLLWCSLQLMSQLVVVVVVVMVVMVVIIVVVVLFSIDIPCQLFAQVEVGWRRSKVGWQILFRHDVRRTHTLVERVERDILRTLPRLPGPDGPLPLLGW